MTFRKPYLISWLAIPILLLIGLLFRQHTVNVQLYDTYFVIANRHVALAGSALLLVLGFGYWLLQRTRKTPNGILTAFHLWLTIGVLLLLVLPIFSRNDLISTQWLFESIVVLLLGQCAYVANMLITWLRR
ncbi:hypothetical protein [Spirosoma pulveris]